MDNEPIYRQLEDMPGSSYSVDEETPLNSGKKSMKDKFMEAVTYEKIKTRSTYYLPILSWLPQYKIKEYLIADIIAGLTVSFVIIPQGISYGTLAFVEPIFGLYCAFLPPLVYSFLGSSKHLSIGPEAVASLLVGQTVAKLYDTDDPETLPQRAAVAATLGFAAGLITLVAGILRLGFLDSILSKATITGFITAVSFVIMIEQLGNLFGINLHQDGWEEDSSPFNKLAFILTHLDESRGLTCAIGLSGLFFLFLMNFLKGKFPSSLFLKFFPSVLFVVVASCLVTWGFDLDVDYFGDVKGGFQVVASYDFENFGTIITSAFTIMIVGFIETVVCAKKFAEKNSYNVSDNRELVAVGTANMIASIFGAYPSFGSFPRTKLNDGVGGKTQFSGVVTSLTALLAILFLLPAFYYLPRAISSAIVFFAAFSLLEFENIIFLVKIRAVKDIILMLVTLFVTLAVSIDIGIFVSIAISLVLVVKEVTGSPFDVLGVTPDNKYQPVEEDSGNYVQTLDDIIIIRFKEALFFARIGFLTDKLRRVEKYGTLFAHPSDDAYPRALKAVIFDLSRMDKIDASALKLFKELCIDYKNKGIQVYIVKLRPECRDNFKSSGLIDIIGRDFFFRKVKEAVEFINGHGRRPYSTHNSTPSEISLPLKA